MTHKLPFAKSRIEYVRNLVNPSKKDIVLNVGISNVPEMEIYLEDNVKECWTIDIDNKKLEKARKYLRKTTLVLGDISNDKILKRNYFDKVIILEVLEHLDKDLETLKLINTLMKKDGKIILSVPNKNLLHVINPVKYTQHKRHYSNYDIVKKLKESGFKVEHLNVVENWSLFANLYVHLFFKYVLGRTKNFLTFNKYFNKTYTRMNNIGLDIVVLATKI